MEDLCRWAIGARHAPQRLCDPHAASLGAHVRRKERAGASERLSGRPCQLSSTPKKTPRSDGLQLSSEGLLVQPVQEQNTFSAPVLEANIASRCPNAWSGPTRRLTRSGTDGLNLDILDTLVHHPSQANGPCMIMHALFAWLHRGFLHGVLLARGRADCSNRCKKSPKQAYGSSGWSWLTLKPINSD